MAKDIEVSNEEQELEDRLIAVKRVAKVVKGGRNFGFNALVAVGDRKSKIGLGLGKANDISEAIRKGVDKAKRNICKVSVENGTIPHSTVGRYGAGKVVLKPAAPGTGVIAGGPARAVLELSGIKNILTKCIGTTNELNVAKATLEGLKSMRTWEDVCKQRELTEKVEG